jgi:hypothetical protein
MIVTVESNFVLEIALRQDEVAECERLIALAGTGSIRLAMPACSLFEPFETMVRRRKQRDESFPVRSPTFGVGRAANAHSG